MFDSRCGKTSLSDLQGCRQHLRDISGRGLGPHHACPGHDLFAGQQVEAAIEVHTGPARVQLDDGRFTPRVPDGLQRRLQVEGSLVFRYDDGLGGVLRCVDQFFSSCSANSATLRAERDLYCLAGC